MTELTKILGKSYEKLKKILRKTYDHNLAILSWPFEAQTQINTSFYAKPVRKEKLIKTIRCFADWSKRRYVTFIIIEC